MLVCNVSLRPPRRAITAAIAEAITATDALATGNIVFATLVDDPANVRDIVDAYSGEIMLEATSADAVADAGLTYVAAVLEETTAVAAHDGAIPTVYTGAVAETASASDAPSATVGGATAVTTTGIAVGPLFMFDTTFPASSLTVINAGR